ncbi:MAG: hypothetical protein NUW08_01285 [Candidatus Uhrbacteria bacterium]|nr:hypothetical protein [Candidatus Uhrbacteria bacterium]
MIVRLVIAGLLGLLAACFEVGAVPFLPVWAGFRPVVPLIALLLVSASRSRAFAFAMGAALVLDAYTLDQFDLALVRLPLLVFVLGWIADRFLTNRSVYATAALVVCGRALDWLSAWAISFLAVLFNLHDTLWSLPGAPILVLCWDVVFTSLVFLGIASFTGRFIVRPGSSYAPR